MWYGSDCLYIQMLAPSLPEPEPPPQHNRETKTILSSITEEQTYSPTNNYQQTPTYYTDEQQPESI